jgi:hypothetical protein
MVPEECLTNVILKAVGEQPENMEDPIIIFGDEDGLLRAHNSFENLSPHKPFI